MKFSLLAAVVLTLALTIPPAPTARVNDYAQLLSRRAAADRGALTEREQATGVQMVIAIFPSLDGESLEDFGIRLAERWRVGDKRLDTGVILLVFVQERRVRLEVGYGLEPVLPDAAAGQIIREAVAPRFREERYAEGLQAAVQAVYARVEGGAAARPTVPPAPRHTFGVSPWTLGVLPWSSASSRRSWPARASARAGGRPPRLHRRRPRRLELARRALPAPLGRWRGQQR